MIISFLIIIQEIMSLADAFKKIIFEINKRRKPIETAKKIGVKVGNNCRFMDWPVFGSEPYLIEIGDDCTISSEVAFITHDGGNWVFRRQEKYKNVLSFGKIKVGNNCFIGMRSMIMPGVTIGNNCVIGAASLVTKSIPDGEVWGGVPAHFIRKTEEYAEISYKKTPMYDVDNFRCNRREELERILK